MDISPEKVASLIVRAREYEAKVAASDSDPEAAVEQFGAALEDRPRDTTRAEIANFIRGLNADEQANLVALAWIGRGSHEPEDWDEALAEARSEQDRSTVRYLLGEPLLADYLEAGLDALGFRPAGFEEDVG